MELGTALYYTRVLYTVHIVHCIAYILYIQHERPRAPEVSLRNQAHSCLFPSGFQSVLKVEHPASNPAHFLRPVTVF